MKKLLSALVMLVMVLGLLPAGITSASAQDDENSRENPIEVGEAADVGDYEISVVDVTPNANDLIAESNQFNEAPADGYQFYMTLVSVTYSGAETGNPFYDLNFQAVGASNTGYTEFENDCGVFENSLLDAPEMFEGGSGEYNVCWQVKSDDVDSLVMYAESLFSQGEDERVWFSLGNPNTGTPESDPDAGNDTSNVDIQEESSREEPIAIGKSGKVGDFEIGVVSVTPNVDDLIAEANQFNEPPGEDNQFFMARIEIRYTGSDTGNPFIDLNPQAVGDNSIAYTTYDNSCGVYEESLFDAPEMFEGSTTEVNVCWQISSKDEDSLVMFIEPLFSVDNERVWFSLQEE